MFTSKSEDKMIKKNIKKISWGLTILLMLFLAYRIYELIFSLEAGSGFQNGQRNRAIAIEVSNITFEKIKDIKEFSGTISPEYKYLITPKISGMLISVTKRIGDRVLKGEVIAKIDDAEYQQSLLEAKANFKIGEATLYDAKRQLEIAELEMLRADSLNKNGYISSAEYDKVKAELISASSKLKMAKAQIEQKKAALKLAEIKLEYTILKANQAGYIGERYYDEGAMVNSGTPVVSVIGINKVYLKSSIIEKDYGKINPGKKATAQTAAYPDHIFNGVITNIAPLLNEESRMAEMEILIENKDDLLKPGMFCKIKIVLNEKEKAQIVPAKAIVKENGNQGVFIVKPNSDTVNYHQVITGIKSESKIEIVNPVLTGKIVTVGQHQLKDKSKIIISR